MTSAGAGHQEQSRLHSPAPSSVVAAPSSGGSVTPAFVSNADSTRCDNASMSAHRDTQLSSK